MNVVGFPSMVCPFNKEKECDCRNQPAAMYFMGVEGLTQLMVLDQLIRTAIEEERPISAEEILVFAGMGKREVDENILKREYLYVLQQIGLRPEDCPNYDPRQIPPIRTG